MDHQKKNLEITGWPIFPVVIGDVAYICEADTLRRTSTVLHLEQISDQEIRFETKNTIYLLHCRVPHLSVMNQEAV